MQTQLINFFPASLPILVWPVKKHLFKFALNIFLVVNLQRPSVWYAKKTYTFKFKVITKNDSGKGLMLVRVLPDYLQFKKGGIGK